ncbi:DUF2853 family protein [Bartonella sp. DGB1]|uniref:DUF2853 family protein n=1 Tax=Bartonella sp. DGB1 TaxID=3239807 RepID=UPI003526966E
MSVYENNDLQRYINDIARYLGNSVDEDIVRKLVGYLSIALKGKDARYVAAGDPAELAYVVKNWVQKILHVDPEPAKQAVDETASRMRQDSHKNRVTFYYLVAEKLDKLEEIRKLS